MRRRASVLLQWSMLALLTGALTACGQKGPLYLPDKTGEVVTRPTQTPPEVPPTEVATPAVAAPANASSSDPDKDGDADKNKKDAATPPR